MATREAFLEFDYSPLGLERMVSFMLVLASRGVIYHMTNNEDSILVIWNVACH